MDSSNTDYPLIIGNKETSIEEITDPNFVKSLIQNDEKLSKPTEMGKEIGGMLKSIFSELPKESALGKMLSGITDPTTTMGGKFHNVFGALEKGEALGPSLVELLDTSSVAGDIAIKHKDLINAVEDKAKFMISEESLKLFRNYNSTFNVTALGGDKENTYKLLDIGNPFIFDLESPIKQKWIKIFNTLSPVESGSDIKVRYDILMYISENRFTELWYLLRCKSYLELKDKMEDY